MADFKLALGDVDGLEIVLANNDLATDGGLAAATALSLFCDRRVNPEELPDGATDRRGWWGDAFDPPGDPGIGSRLWLLAREKQRPDVLTRAREYAEEALRWMVDDGVARSVSASVVFLRDAPTAPVDVPGIFLSVEIAKPNGDALVFRYSLTWTDHGLE